MTEQKGTPPPKNIEGQVQQIKQQSSEKLAKDATGFADDASKRENSAIAAFFDDLSVRIRRKGQTRTEPSDN